MAASRTMTGSALRTAALLVTVLGLIAGILGMHVMTGTHSAHATMVSSAMTATPGDDPAAAGKDDAGHAAHLTSSRTGAAAPVGGVSTGAFPAQCSCSGNCTSGQSMNVSCVPSLASGGLSAPTPAETLSLTAPSQASNILALSIWSYRPGGPSPGELSISRT
jgi:hypothetical protein